MQGLFTTITNVNFDPAAVDALTRRVPDASPGTGQMCIRDSGRAVCTGVVDLNDVANIDLGQHPVNGNLVVVLAQTAHHIVHMVEMCISDRPLHMPTSLSISMS